MKLELRVILLPALVAAVTGPAHAHAQDPCPSASAAEAEAGWTAYQEGEIGEARRRFQAAVERCANDQYARTGLGYVELRQGNEARAESLLGEVVRAEPGNVDALVGLGLVHWREGDLDAARRRFGEVLEYEPDHPTALQYMERLSGDGPRARDEADEAWTQGEVERARQLYEERLQENPADPVALLRLGLMHGWDGDYDEGVDLLDRLLAEEPTNVEGRLARARLVAWSGDLDDAMDAVRDVLALEPDSPDALAALALFQSWSGDAEGALESYDELLTISPGHSEARRAQARALAWAEEYEQALASYEALVAESPEDVEARLGLARARAFSGDVQGSVAEYDRILNSSPDEARAHIGRARTLGWAGRLVEAEKAALEAVEAHGDSGSAWGVLGEVYRWQGRTGAAKEALERAVDLSPNDEAARDQLRSVDLALAPRARPIVRGEDDSDGNRMVTTRLVFRGHPVPRLRIRAEAYHRRLEQELSLGLIQRAAQGVSVRAAYELDPGWTLSGGLGGSATDGFGDPTFTSYSASVRSPTRHRIDGSVELVSTGLDETAALAEQGVRSTRLLLSARWRPDLDWRVDGQIGVGSYEGTEANGRRSVLVTATRSVGRSLLLGAGFRGFSFEKDVLDGYFDPDFYGIAEVSGTWLADPLPWSFLAEVAPGVEQVTRDGDPTLAFRGNGRMAYRVGRASEISLALSYSTASVTTFASGGDGYEYLSLALGVRWVFD